MTTRLLILGAGFGGLEIATRVAQACGDDVDITIVDKAEGFVFGFSKLDVMFGKASAEHVLHPYADIAAPGVRFVGATVLSIDPELKRVETDAGEFDADILVVALGATVHPEATPGLVEDGYEFYTNAGAFALREVLQRFSGGRVVVGVTSTPFKCPPAPSETALLMNTLLVERGLREQSEISLVMPFGRPIPPSPEASEALLTEFAAAGITWVPERAVIALDPDRHVALLSEGDELPYDLFLGIPVHRVPLVVAESGMTEDGWIPVNPLTMATRFPGVYAVGDVTSAGTPKAGVFSEGQAAVAADHIIGDIAGYTSDSAYDGFGRCYLEFGLDRVAQVDISFKTGERPTGMLFGPSAELADDKEEFGASRVRRWFDREWSQLG